MLAHTHAFKHQVDGIYNSILGVHKRGRKIDSMVPVSHIVKSK